MAYIYFIVGSSGSGKSTVEKNIRLRQANKFEPGYYQYVEDQDLLFVGRVLHESQKAVLRFSGGDGTGFEYLFNAVPRHEYLTTVDEFPPQVAGPSTKIIMEKYHIARYVPERLVEEGHSVTFIHIKVTWDQVRSRLEKLGRSSAKKTPDTYQYFRPLREEYLHQRDIELAALGIPVRYVNNDDLETCCKAVETYLQIEPKYPGVLQDFLGPVDQIYSEFTLRVA